MNIAIGGIWHETNTFARDTTPLESFYAYQFARGAEMSRRYKSVRNEIGGMIAGARKNRFKVTPLVFAGAVPSGIVQRDAFETLAGMLLDDLAAIDGVDGVLLALHGAMVVEGLDDAEGELLRRVRALVRDKPIVATFDIHANMSEDMMAHADVLIGYETYPHVDAHERGMQAADVMRGLARGQIDPTVVWYPLSLLSVPQTQGTAQSPMREIMARRAEIAQDPYVVSASVIAGYPYADIERAGMSILITTNDETELAHDYAYELHKMIWERRDAFRAKNTPVAAAVKKAAASTTTPAILVDVADNIGGGAPGDGTVLLKGLLDAQAQAAVVTIADPEAVATAIAAGVGQPVTLQVGGKTDSMHGRPVTVRGTVRLISSGEYAHKGSYMTGQVMRMGRTVVLDCDGLTLVLMERKTMPFDAEQLRSLGIEPADQKIIVVKSAIAWQAAYGDIAREVVYVETPGICTANLKTLPYQKVRRPIFPLEEL